MLNLNFSPFPELQTEFIRLRMLRPEDAGALFELRKNPEVMKYLDRPMMQSVEEAMQLIRMMLDGLLENKNISWCICTPQSEQLLGTIAFWKIDETNHRAEIGYILDPGWQGKGLMSAALQLVLDYGFSKMYLHGVDANVNPANQKSINLLTRAGFKKEAHFRENYYFDGRYTDSAIYCMLNNNTIS